MQDHPPRDRELISGTSMDTIIGHPVSEWIQIHRPLNAKALSDKVGSCDPTQANFRLTPEVKAKFTEKLRQIPKESCGPDAGKIVRTNESTCLQPKNAASVPRKSWVLPPWMGSSGEIYLKPTARIRRFPRPEDGLRAMVERAPQAEAFAESWIARIRPLFLSLYAWRRRIATIAVLVVTVSLFVHVMFGINGMVVYKKKRADYESLQKQIDQVQSDNDRYTQQIHGLKSDQRAIEKEAREQLGYAKPGEYVYVAPVQPKPAPPAFNHTTKK